MAGKNKGGAGVSSGVYGLAFLGALIYYLQTATSFLGGLFGIFKAIFWPAFLIHALMTFLKM